MYEFTLRPEDVVAWAAADTAALDTALAGLGFDADRRASAIEVLVETVEAPAAAGSLDIRQAAGDLQVVIAAGPALVAVLQRPASPGLHSVIVGTVDELPRLVADLVDLGPRPQPSAVDTAVVPADVLDAIAGVGLPADELAELQEFFTGHLQPSALAALFAPASVRWTFTLATGDEEPRRVVDVVDARDGGLWGLLQDADPAALLATPIDPGSVWTVLGEAALGLVPSMAAPGSA